MLPRRAALSCLLSASLSAFALGGCKRRAGCARCGMALDPNSRWYVELDEGGKITGFDTPKCAFTTALGRGSQGTLYFKGYYSQARMPASALVFAQGSDVIGPMGDDLVPVEPEHEAKFRFDHHAKKMNKPGDLKAAEVSEL